jgi:hypothetical protein
MNWILRGFDTKEASDYGNTIGGDGNKENMLYGGSAFTTISRQYIGLKHQRQQHEAADAE